MVFLRDWYNSKAMLPQFDWRTSLSEGSNHVRGNKLAGNVVDRIFETIGGPLGGKNSNVGLSCSALLT